MKQVIVVLPVVLLLLITVIRSSAQVSISNDGSPPDPSAGLEVKSASKGLLAPRVRLVSTDQASPVTNPATGLLVFNTTVSGTPPNNVVAGYYYWNGTAWVYISPPQGSNTGDMLYWNGSQWVRIHAGMPGQYLTMADGNVPAWTGQAYPVVTTADAYNIGYAEAEIGGEVLLDGGAEITARGICYSTDPGPTLDDLNQGSGSGLGAYNCHISGLNDNTLYHVRAYATNSMGTSYGKEVTFTTLLFVTGPSVITSPVTDITQTSASCGGNVMTDGGSAVTERGMCWSTSGTPTVDGNHTAAGAGTGSFFVALSSLASGTTYYIRAYATNYIATNYGAVVSFKTVEPYLPGSCPGTPAITYSNRTYNTVKIGNQCWLRENLNVGTFIYGSASQTNNGIIQKHCYGNDPSNCNVFGGLYEWGEAMNYQNNTSNTTSWNPVPIGPVQGICPSGWHIPTLGEWSELSLYLGDDTIAGYKMKSDSADMWGGPDAGSSNSTHFTGLPGGFGVEGWFDEMWFMAFFWSATERSPTLSMKRVLACYNFDLDNSWSDKNTGFSVRCLKDTTASSLPSVMTTGMTSVGVNTAIAGGSVPTSGGADVTARGFCWSTSPYPNISYPHSVDGTGTGVFSGNLVNLAPLTTYYVRAYATNSAGTSYGEQVVFISGNTPGGEPCAGQPTVTYEGKTYHTLRIANQCWLQENLNVGTRVDGFNTQANNEVIEKYCPEDLESNCDIYGGLYQWGEAIQYLNGASNSANWNPAPTEPVTGICPPGWHIPTDAEWCTMAKALEYTYDCHEENPYMWNVGGKLKEAGTDHWEYPNQGATNSSGFTALPAGLWSPFYSFYFNFKKDSEFWTSTPNNTTPIYTNAWYLFYLDDDLDHSSGSYRLNGCSVRCIKN